MPDQALCLPSTPALCWTPGQVWDEHKGVVVAQTAPGTLKIEQTLLLWDKCAENRFGSTQIQFFFSCNHGLTPWTEKSCDLVRETTAPGAFVPFPILIPASRAERDQGSYKNHGQTVRPWGYLWIWDSKIAVVVKMDCWRHSKSLKPRCCGAAWLHQGPELVWGVTALGWGSGMGGGLLCPAPNVDWLWALGISPANLTERKTELHALWWGAGEECDLAPYFVTPFLK